MRLCVALLFLFLIVPAVPSVADTLPTAGEIEAKAAAAAPKLPDNYRETIVSTGTLGNRKTVRYQRGKDYRITRERGGVHTELGSFQGEAWYTTRNGLTLIDEAAAGKESDEKLVTTVARVSTPVDAYIVSHMNARKAGTRTYYDPVTFQTLRVETIDEYGLQVLTYDELATYGSVKRPKGFTIASKDSNSSQHYERTEFIENAVTEADVQEPTSARTLVEFPSGVNDVTLPTHFDDDEIDVHVTIGKRTVDFVLDTGSSSIVIDQTLARDLGLPLSNASTEITARKYTAYETVIPEMTIGSLKMHDISVDVVPFPTGGRIGAKPLGLLGFDFLAQLGVTIDYAKATVHVNPAAEYDPPKTPGTYAVDIRLGDRIPVTTVTVGNAVAENMVFDTGWNGELGFFDFFTRRYPDAFRNDLGSTGGTGIGGPFTAELFRFPKLALGPFHFVDFVGMRIPSSSFNFDGDGAIGTSVLSMFTVGLNYTNGRMFLTPNANGMKSATKRK